MPKFLFWNLNKKPLENTIVRLAAVHDVDVLMFAECGISPATLLTTLNTEGASDYHYAPCRECTKIHLYTRFSDRLLPILLETDRLTIRRMTLPNSPEILLAVVHVISKVHYSRESQEEESRELSRTIREAEDFAGHRRTVLCGDLNMNPFEYGVVGAGTLNAAMTKEIALRPARTIQNRSFRYFYNPMWAHFGDATGTPPGTLYYPKSDHLCYYWNMFDQVLLRPELLPMWNAETLTILKNDGEQVFLNDFGRITDDEMSDHLPIVFELSF
jgi:hypothetical protein